MTLRQRAKYLIYNSAPGFSGRFPYYGTNVYFQRSAQSFRVVCASGTYEAEVVNVTTHLVRPNTTMLDVGANIGLMAIPVLRCCPTCQVISFEPSPNSLPYLQRTANESAYADRWRVVGKGVARQAGTLEFAFGAPHEALFEGFKSRERLSHPRVVDVPVESLDDEWRELGSPDVSLVKIDVEGAERGVLEGASDLINARHPSLVIEWQQSYLAGFDTSPDWLLSFAAGFGYRIFSVPGGVPIDEPRTLRMQMMSCYNFALLC